MGAKNYEKELASGADMNQGYKEINEIGIHGVSCVPAPKLQEQNDSSEVAGV